MRKYKWWFFASNKFHSRLESNDGEPVCTLAYWLTYYFRTRHRVIPSLYGWHCGLWYQTRNTMTGYYVRQITKELIMKRLYGSNSQHLNEIPYCTCLHIHNSELQEHGTDHQIMIGLELLQLNPQFKHWISPI